MEELLEAELPVRLEVAQPVLEEPLYIREARVWGLGFRVWGLGFRVYIGFRVWGLGFRVYIGFRVWGLGFRVWGLGFGV